MILKAGQEVWIYRAPIKPFKAKIVEQVDDFQAYRIRTPEMNISQVETYIRSYIFVCPEEKNKLISTLRDQAYDLERYADELYQED